MISKLEMKLKIAPRNNKDPTQPKLKYIYIKKASLSIKFGQLVLVEDQLVTISVKSIEILTIGFRGDVYNFKYSYKGTY